MNLMTNFTVLMKKYQKKYEYPENLFMFLSVEAINWEIWEIIEAVKWEIDEKDMTENEAIENITDELKSLAKILDIPIITAQHLQQHYDEEKREKLTKTFMDITNGYGLSNEQKLRMMEFVDNELTSVQKTLLALFFEQKMNISQCARERKRSSTRCRQALQKGTLRLMCGFTTDTFDYILFGNDEQISDLAESNTIFESVDIHDSTIYKLLQDPEGLVGLPLAEVVGYFDTLLNDCWIDISMPFYPWYRYLKSILPLKVEEESNIIVREMLPIEILNLSEFAYNTVSKIRANRLINNAIIDELIYAMKFKLKEILELHNVGIISVIDIFNALNEKGFINGADPEWEFLRTAKKYFYLKKKLFNK